MSAVMLRSDLTGREAWDPRSEQVFWENGTRLLAVIDFDECKGAACGCTYRGKSRFTKHKQSIC